MQTEMFRKAERVAIVATAALLLALPGMAQQPDSSATPPPPPAAGEHRGPHGPGGPMAREMRELNLTPEQHAQVKTIHEDARSKMEALRSNTSLSQQERHAQMMQLHQETMAKVRAVLTDEQKTKFDAMQKDMEARMREHHDHGMGMHPDGMHNGATPPPPPPPPPAAPPSGN